MPAPRSARYKGWWHDIENSRGGIYYGDGGASDPVEVIRVTGSAVTILQQLTFSGYDTIIADTYGLLVGSATQVTISDGDGATNLIPEVQVLGTAAADGSLLVAAFNTTNTRAVSPHIALVKGAAATQVATTALADNEVAGSIIAYGSDGTDFESPVAAIEFVVDDASGPTTGEMGGSLEFYTTADGGETLTLAYTVNNAQNILVGSGTSLTISDGDGATNLIPGMQVLGTSAARGTLALASFNTTNTRAVAPHLAFVKGAAATQVATTGVASGEILGSIIWYGSDAADFESPAAAIEGVVQSSTDPVTAGIMGGQLTFYTTANGGETLTLFGTINNDQNLFVANNNGVVIGHTAQVAVLAATPEVQVLGTAAADSGLLLLRSSGDATGPIIYLAKARDAIGTFSTAITTGDVLGGIEAIGADTADLNANSNAAAAIRFVSSGTIAADRIPGEIRFLTATDAAPSVLTQTMSISNAGVVDMPFTLTVGTAGTRTGTIGIDGGTSGTVTLTVAAAAGTWTYTLPATAGEAGDVQVTDGTGIASWVSGVRSVDVQLTNAQLLALLGTDITLVAAPGANRGIVVHAVYMFFDVTTTAYTINAGATTIGYASDGATVATITEAGFLDTVADAGRWYQLGGAAATPEIITPVANAAIVIRKATADMTGGNAANTLSIRVYYSVVDLVAFT